MSCEAAQLDARLRGYTVTGICDVTSLMWSRQQVHWQCARCADWLGKLCCAGAAAAYACACVSQSGMCDFVRDFMYQLFSLTHTGMYQYVGGCMHYSGCGAI